MLLDAQASGKLKDLVNASPLTQENLAQAVGITANSSRQNKDQSLKRMFQRIETAGTLAIIGKICAALEIDPLEFLFPEETEKLQRGSKTSDVFELVGRLSREELMDLQRVVTVLLKRKNRESDS